MQNSAAQKLFVFFALMSQKFQTVLADQLVRDNKFAKKRCLQNVGTISNNARFTLPSSPNLLRARKANRVVMAPPHGPMSRSVILSSASERRDDYKCMTQLPGQFIISFRDHLSSNIFTNIFSFIPEGNLRTFPCSSTCGSIRG